MSIGIRCSGEVEEKNYNIELSMGQKGTLHMKGGVPFCRKYEYVNNYKKALLICLMYQQGFKIMQFKIYAL